MLLVYVVVIRYLFNEFEFIVALVYLVFFLLEDVNPCICCITLCRWFIASLLLLLHHYCYYCFYLSAFYKL